MGVTNYEIGKIGEDLVAAYLKNKGVSILERNFRCRLGEIDLIAKEGDQLVFIEVKTRRGTGFGVPEESVGRLKQRRLRQVASTYLLRFKAALPRCRFDVYSILLDNETRLVQLKRTENCF